MWFTSVKVEFMILGDNILPEEITRRLGISPSLKWLKGEPLKGGGVQECSGWEINTDYEKSLDINGQLNLVIDKIKEKREELKYICNRDGMESKFSIVIKIENGQTPAIVMNREVIELAYSINAEIEFDVYANPYTDEE